MKMLSILLLLGGCSFLSTKTDKSSSLQDPEWLYSPYATCTEATELCATGEANNMAGADAQARANLASIFEVQVKSTLNQQQSSSSISPSQSRMNEEVQSSLDESVDEILENVQIKKRFKKDGLTYSLASLDKVIASDLISSRMRKVDEELGVLWEKRNRTNLRKIMKLQLEREKLNERFATVSGMQKPAKLSHAEVIRWKESRPEWVALSLRVGQAPEWMTEKLKELLTESGFKIVKGESIRVVSLTVDSIKEFLNVEGFEKYTFTLNLTSFENGEKRRVLSASETVTGRNQADALLKVKTYFTNYIEEHLSDLQLD